MGTWAACHKPAALHLIMPSGPSRSTPWETQRGGLVHLLLPGSGPRAVSHEKKHFSGCHTGMEGGWGITTKCVDIAPNNDSFPRISHSNTEWGNSSPCQDLLCSKLKSHKRNSCSTQPCANKPCPTTLRELPGSAESSKARAGHPTHGLTSPHLGTTNSSH